MSTPARPAAAHGWRIGSLAGTPVYLGRSWPIIAVLIVVVFGPNLSRPDRGASTATCWPPATPCFFSSRCSCTRRPTLLPPAGGVTRSAGSSPTSGVDTPSTTRTAPRRPRPPSSPSSARSPTWPRRGRLGPAGPDDERDGPDAARHRRLRQPPRRPLQPAPRPAAGRRPDRQRPGVAGHRAARAAASSRPAGSAASWRC